MSMSRRGQAQAPLAALASKASLLAEQLGTGLYEGCAEAEDFPIMADTIRRKHASWAAQLKKYGSSGEKLVAGKVQAATKKLRDEESRLRKLHSSCYMQCFAATRFLFPTDLTATVQGVIDTFENLPLLLEDQSTSIEEPPDHIFIVGGQDLEGYSKLISEPDEEESEEFSRDPLHHSVQIQPKTSVHGLPFAVDRRFLTTSTGSSIIGKAKEALESRIGGPHVVVLEGGPGAGKSSIARHLALHYSNYDHHDQNHNEKSLSVLGSRFSDGVFFLDCSGGVDVKAKQLELLGILEYPLHRLLTSGESQHLTGAEIHRRIVEHMGEKEVLVVLDNVEDCDLLQHLLVPSQTVKYLVTSELRLLWAGTLNLQVAPMAMEDARRILTQHTGHGSSEPGIPSQLKKIANSLITATDANPLALAGLSMAMTRSRGASGWEDVQIEFCRIMESDDQGLRSLGEQYPRPVAVSMALAVDQLPLEARSILLAMAAFDDLPIPEVVVRLLLRCTDCTPCSSFSKWRDYLIERGLIWQLRQSVPWSTSHQSSLSMHGIRRACVSVIRRREIERMVGNLLGRVQVTGNHRTQDSSGGLSSDAALMAALFVVYGEGDLAVRAAGKLGVRDFGHMGNLILSWVAPLVSLLRVADDYEEWQQQFHMTHILARQVILEFICHGNPENGITGLLALPEAAPTVCWALAVHALDEPVLIANYSILKGLLNLLAKNVDPVTQKSAAWALANIAVSEEAKKYNLAKFPGFLKGFVGLLGRTKDMEDDIQNIVAWMLMVVGEVEENRVDLAAFPGALQGLARLLRCKKGHRGLSVKLSDTQRNAAWALANITVARENKAIIATLPGAMQGLVRLLGKDVSPCTQAKAAWALANMAEAWENKLRIAVFPGALKGLVKLLSVEPDLPHSLHHYPQQQSHERLVAARALCNLNAAWALANLSEAKENKVTIAIFPGALKGLVRLLNKDVNSQIRCSAAWALVHLAATAETKVAIVSIPGAVEGLVGLLDLSESIDNHQTTWTWRNLSAAWALGSLADVKENRAIIASCPGALKGLVGLLGIRKNVNLHIQCRATWALANISAAGAHQEAIAAFPGALLGLVGLLNKEVSSQTQGNATRAVAHIVEAKKNRVVVTKFAGVLEGLVLLLGKHVSSYNTQNNAARALATMATAEENRVVIANCPGALEGLVRLLGNTESPAAQMNAAWALANLAEVPVNKLKISNVPGAIERLLMLLEEYVEAEVQAVAARTLTQIAANTSNRLILRSAEAYRSRAIVNIEMGNYQQALADLDRALKLQPGNPFTFSWRRFVRAMLQDYKGALSDANKALALQPHKPFHWQERGVLKRMMGNLHGALTDLSRGLHMNPNDYETLKHRAYVKFLMHDQAGACLDAECAMATKPSHLEDPGYGACFLGGFGVEFLVYKLK